MNELFKDWRNVLPLAGLAALAAVGVVLAFRRKPEDIDDLERRRRAYLNRVGRVVEGHILEIAEHDSSAGAGSARKSGPATGASKDKSGPRFPRMRHAGVSNSVRKLLYYTYAISGVSYETAQDITGMEERLHLARVAAGQIASVKYDPSNPSNSILLADDWSGLH